jgi:hypothetical protein
MFKFLTASVALTYMIITQQVAHAQAPILQVSPATDISVEGASKGGEFKYTLSSHPLAALASSFPGYRAG